jgi:(5-formylfuran-3-yl)methyl phosphate synthase
MTPQLLVSVRSVAEAEEALAGGADLIDVKEPTLGSLGRPSDAVVAEIVEFVAGRAPTSAALGELRDWDGTMPGGVDFVKAGLAGLAGTDWRARLDAFRAAAAGRAVIVAYADWKVANAPSMTDVVDHAEAIEGSTLLIDTNRKGKSTLFDFADHPILAAFVAKIRRAEGRIALAGSLNLSSASRCASLRSDWVGVRGIVCDGGRAGIVRRDRVRKLKACIVDADFKVVETGS